MCDQTISQSLMDRQEISNNRMVLHKCWRPVFSLLGSYVDRWHFWPVGESFLNGISKCITLFSALQWCGRGHI